MSTITAIIPARGGSKGLPGKNIRPLQGHPLIAYSIRAAQLTPSINRIIVSTDDEAIAEVSRQYGAETPFVRPAAFAGDHSTDLEVFQHALQWLQQHEGQVPELVVQLRPTSPVRRADHMEQCIQRMLQQPEADSLRIVTPAPANPYKMWLVPHAHGPMQPLLQVPGMDEPYNMPRQLLPQAYWQIGYLDVIRSRVIQQGSMSGRIILPFVVGNEFAVDIDDIASFDKAWQAILQTESVRF